MAKNPNESENRLSIWLDKLTKKQLEEIAQQEDRSAAWIVRQAIESYIEDYKPTKGRQKK